MRMSGTFRAVALVWSPLLIFALQPSLGVADSSSLPIPIGETQSPTSVQVRNLYQCEMREISVELTSRNDKVLLVQYAVNGRAMDDDQRVKINERLSVLGHINDVSLDCGRAFELISVGGDSPRGAHTPTRVNLRIVEGRLAY
jgi:hypothetical protein